MTEETKKHGLHPTVYAAVVAVVSCALTAILCITFSVHYTNRATNKAVHTAEQNTQKSQQIWCAVILTIDEAYHSSTPTSPIGKTLALQFDALKKSIGC